MYKSTITKTFMGDAVRFEWRDDGNLLVSIHGRMGGFKGSALLSQQDALKISEYLQQDALKISEYLTEKDKTDGEK